MQVKIFDPVTVAGDVRLVLRAQCELAECFPDDVDGLQAALLEIEVFGATMVGGGAAPLVMLERV